MRKLSKTLPLFLITTILLLSCSGGGPEETFELMRKEACNGSPDNFFAYMDKHSIARDYNMQVAKRQLEENEDLTSTEKLYIYLTRQLQIYDITPIYDGIYATPSTAEFLERLLWKYFRSDIENEEQNDICSLEIESIDSKDYNIAFSFKGEDYKWKFKRTSKGWRVVSVNFDEVHFARGEEYPSYDEEYGSGEDISSILDIDGDNNYDFRKTRWGMSQEEVKSSEDSEYLGTAEIDMKDEELDTTDKYDTTLVYVDKIGGLDVQVVYIFTNEKLSQAFYQFKNRYSDPDTYLTNYNEMVDALENKYGEPSEIKEDWKDEKDKNDPEKLGKALREGHINLSTTWQTPDTELTVGFSYKSEDVPMYAYYLSKHYDEKYERLERHREEEKNKEAEKEIEDKQIEEKL